MNSEERLQNSIRDLKMNRDPRQHHYLLNEFWTASTKWYNEMRELNQKAKDATP